MPITRDQMSEQKWAARWRAEADRTNAAEAKLARIEALCNEHEGTIDGLWQFRVAVRAALRGDNG